MGRESRKLWCVCVCVGGGGGGVQGVLQQPDGSNQTKIY